MGFLDPYAVDGATIHAAQLRQVYYDAVRGETGVLGAEALKAVGIPGSPGALGIMPGGGAITVESRRETYQVFNDAMDGSAVITVPPAGGNSTTWHVIIEVTDPQYHGQEPGVEARLVSTLAGLTLPYLYIASFTLPPGGGFDVTTPIVDQRRVVMSRSSREIKTIPGVTAAQTLTNTSFVRWPSQTVTVDVPTWANYCIVRAEVLAGHFGNADAEGELRIMIGGAPDSGKVIGTQAFNLDWGTDPQRVPLLIIGETDIAESMGLTRTITIQGRKIAAGGAGYIGTVDRSYAIIDIQFQERPL